MPRRPWGRKRAVWVSSVAAVGEGREAKFQGGLPGHLHFGQEQQALAGLDFQHPEEIQGVAGVQFGGVAPAAPEP